MNLRKFERLVQRDTPDWDIQHAKMSTGAQKLLTLNVTYVGPKPPRWMVGRLLKDIFYKNKGLKLYKIANRHSRSLRPHPKRLAVNVR